MQDNRNILWTRFNSQCRPFGSAIQQQVPMKQGAYCSMSGTCSFQCKFQVKMIDLFIEYQPKSYSDLVIKYFWTYEEDLVKERKARPLKRRWFWSAGVNDMVAVDQHDKWKCFGLALHTGIDPFPGKVHWMKVWHMNNNPKIILSYYLEFIEKFGCEFNPVFIFRPTNSAFAQLRHAPYHTK